MMNRSPVTEARQAEYRALPPPTFDLDDVVRGGRRRVRRRVARRTAGLVLAVVAVTGAGVFVVEERVAVQQVLVGERADDDVSAGCLSPQDVEACEALIQQWSRRAGWDLAGRSFRQHPAYSPGSFFLAAEQARPGSETVRDSFQVVVTPGPLDGVQARLEPLPTVGHLRLSDGSVAEVRDATGTQHLREVRLPARPGRVGAIVSITSFDEAAVGDSDTPPPEEWDAQVLRLLDALVGGG